MKNPINFIKSEVNLWTLNPSLWRRKNLQPKLTINNLEQLDAVRLKTAGIEAIAIDYDGVVVPYHSYSQPSHGKVEKLRQLSDQFSVGILSNRKGKLLESLREMISNLNIPILNCEKMKPHPIAYKAAAEKLGASIEKTAIIEDRLVTGVAGANKQGMFTVWVTPPIVETREPLNVRMYRRTEEGILKVYTWLSGS